MSNKLIKKDSVRSVGLCSYMLLIFMPMVLIFSNAFSQEKKDRPMQGFINLKIHYKEAKLNDTLILMVAPKYLRSEKIKNMLKYKSIIGTSGLFEFQIPVTEGQGYWQLYKANTKDIFANVTALTIPFLWEINDSVALELSNIEMAAGIHSQYHFEGRGSEKYECRHKVESLRPNIKSITDKAEFNFNAPNVEVIKSKFQFVDENCSDMSLNSIISLKTDLAFRQGLAIFSAFRNYLTKQGTDNLAKEDLLRKCAKIFSTRELIKFDSIIIAASPYAIEYFYYGLKTESLIRFGKDNPKWIYDQIKIRYNGMFKDELIAYQFTFERVGGNSQRIYEDALNEVRTDNAKAMLLAVQNNYKNSQFGDYEITDKLGKVFNLSSLKGKVMLIDFYFTGCGACIVYYKDVLSIVEEKFKNDPDVVFVSVSMDKSFKKWIESLNAGIYVNKESPFNFYTGGQAEDHLIIKENGVLGGPTVLLVDSKNRICQFNTSNLYEIPSLVKAIKDAK